jgi:hypothetical protein
MIKKLPLRIFNRLLWYILTLIYICLIKLNYDGVSKSQISDNQTDNVEQWFDKMVSNLEKYDQALFDVIF